MYYNAVKIQYKLQFQCFKALNMRIISSFMPAFDFQIQMTCQPLCVSPVERNSTSDSRDLYSDDICLQTGPSMTTEYVKNISQNVVLKTGQIKLPSVGQKILQKFRVIFTYYFLGLRILFTAWQSPFAKLGSPVPAVSPPNPPGTPNLHASVAAWRKDLGSVCKPYSAVTKTSITNPVFSTNPKHCPIPASVKTINSTLAKTSTHIFSVSKCGLNKFLKHCQLSS